MINRIAKDQAVLDDLAADWRAYVPGARAAVEAMRHPTSAMLAAARKVARDYDINHHCVFEAYREMIDAALDEPDDLAIRMARAIIDPRSVAPFRPDEGLMAWRLRAAMVVHSEAFPSEREGGAPAAPEGGDAQ